MLDSSAEGVEEHSHRGQAGKLYRGVGATQIVIDAQQQDQEAANQKDENLFKVGAQSLRQQVVNQAEDRESNQNREEDRDAAETRYGPLMHTAAVPGLVYQSVALAETSQPWRQDKRRAGSNQKECKICFQWLGSLFYSMTKTLSGRLKLCGRSLCRARSRLGSDGLNFLDEPWQQLRL